MAKRPIKTEKFLTDRIEHNLTFNCFDHYRQYPLNEMCVWLEDFSKVRLLEFVYDETRINKLAEMYNKSTHDAAIVATICDEVIDKSGKLLSEVRKAARSEYENELLNKTK